MESAGRDGKEEIKIDTRGGGGKGDPLGSLVESITINTKRRTWWDGGNQVYCPETWEVSLTLETAEFSQ